MYVVRCPGLPLAVLVADRSEFKYAARGTDSSCVLYALMLSYFVWIQPLLVYMSSRFCMYVSVIHVKPFFVPVDTQHNRCS